LSLVEIPKNIQMIDLTQNEPVMEVDVDKMKRLFVNIIKNAIDAMPNGGKITVQSSQVNGKMRISFSDTGSGMTKEALAKLWTPLFTTKAKGMGLGLAICKRIVEAHDGSVNAESTVGEGTTFTIIIPIRAELRAKGEKVWVKEPESSLLTTMKASEKR